MTILVVREPRDRIVARESTSWRPRCGRMRELARRTRPGPGENLLSLTGPPVQVRVTIRGARTWVVAGDPGLAARCGNLSGRAAGPAGRRETTEHVLAALPLRREPGPAGRRPVRPDGRGQDLRAVRRPDPHRVDARPVRSRSSRMCSWSPASPSGSTNWACRWSTTPCPTPARRSASTPPSWRRLPSGSSAWPATCRSSPPGS